MTTNKTISILGLGWLGLPLAKALLSKGYKVKGTVTNDEKAALLADSGIDVSLLTLHHQHMVLTNASFFDTDVLIVNIPPRRTDGIETIYPAQVMQLLPSIVRCQIGKVIFVSSTSVYPASEGTAIESETGLKPDKPSGVACLNAENVLQNDTRFATTVIRFGGLIGADRNPHRFMRSGVKNEAGNQPVNLIHLDDSIGIIAHLIENEIWGEVINGCCPVHPTREEFYRKAAEVAGVEPPLFENNSVEKHKTVSSEKIIELGYQFKYQSPIDCLISMNQ